jgi:cardiolipin synthase
MYNTLSRTKTLSTVLAYLVAVALCVLLTACDVNVSLPGNFGDTSGGKCLSNCTVGSGVHGVQVFVEPDSGEHVITDAIRSAQKSVWLEIYLLTDRNVISARQLPQP